VSATNQTHATPVKLIGIVFFWQSESSQENQGSEKRQGQQLSKAGVWLNT
jgi:hypothetical protein